MSLLEGIRVVDMGLWVAGPASAGILADWGADVVKVEMLQGDPMRKLFGALSGSKEDRCPPFDLYNRGKKSIALDVNHAEGARLVQRLIASCRRVPHQHAAAVPAARGTRSCRAARQASAARLCQLDRVRPRGSRQGRARIRHGGLLGRSGIADRATPPGGRRRSFPAAWATTSPRWRSPAASRPRCSIASAPARDNSCRPRCCAPASTASAWTWRRAWAWGGIAPVLPRTRPQNPLMNLYQGRRRQVVLAGGRRVGSPLADRRQGAGRRGTRLLTNASRHRATAVAMAKRWLRRSTRCSPPSRAEWAEIFAQRRVVGAGQHGRRPAARSAGAGSRRIRRRAGARTGRSRDASTGRHTGRFQLDAVAPRGPPPLVGAHADALLAELGIDRDEIARLRTAGVLAS